MINRIGLFGGIKFKQLYIRNKRTMEREYRETARKQMKVKKFYQQWSETK